MSGYKGHLTGGIISFIILYLIVSYLFFQPSPELLIWGIGITLLGSIWPDVDTNSKGQDVFYGVFLITDIYLLVTKQFQYAAYLGFFALLPIVGQHRGWTHTWWSAVLIPSPILLYPYFTQGNIPNSAVYFYLCAEAGYFSHLVMDRKLF